MNQIACHVALASVVLAVSLSEASAEDAPNRAEAARLAGEAYLFGYPLVLMDYSRQVMTAVPAPTHTSAPANQFNVSMEFPDPSFTNVVSPNADTLYSMSWLDLSNGPIVLSLPDTGDRYYLMQMMDAWSNVFASPGTRTTGNRAGDYVIVAPNWNGTLPAGVDEIRSPTRMVWILGRTQTNGKADYAAVRALKSRYKLTPLSAWGLPYSPPSQVPIDPKVDGKTAPVEQVERLDASAFFARLAALMRDNPPAEVDKLMIEKLARIGIVPGRSFDPSKLGPEVVTGIAQGFQDARAGLHREGVTLGGVKPVNGWAVSLDVGRYGTDYRHRAVIALVGLGANLTEDAVYPMTGVDAEGRPLVGTNRYVLNFPKGQIPPVNAFWSLTMYNAKHFFVENPLQRQALGDRDKLAFNPDGSLTLYLQRDQPDKDKVSNWLPAPEGEFFLILRLYWPKAQVLDGTWKPPGVERVN
jgi:hypothetical protein